MALKAGGTSTLTNLTKLSPCNPLGYENWGQELRKYWCQLLLYKFLRCSELEFRGISLNE
jgi:hypothetical protein